MTTSPRKDRTEAEWRSRYDRAGLGVECITLVNERSGESVIEGTRARRKFASERVV